MDAKKTNLTPELKEIYDRVMNTSGGPAQAAKPTSPSPATPAAAAPNPLTAPPDAAPNGNQLPGMPSNGAPAMGAVPDNAPKSPPAPGAPASVNQAMPPLPDLNATQSPADQALTSTPARPLSEGNTFAFNGGSHPAPGPQAATAKTAKGKTKISLPILIVLGVAFLAVWGVFWAVIFGFIQR